MRKLYQDEPPSTEFVQVVQCLAAANGNPAKAEKLARERGLSNRVSKALELFYHDLSFVSRSAVLPGVTTDVTWAGPLVEYASLQDAWLDSRMQAYLYDGIRLGGMLPLPPRTHLAIVTVVATASNLAEAKWIPVTRLAIDDAITLPQKSAGLLVVSAEILRFGTALAERLFSTELEKAVGLSTDGPTRDALLQGATVISSSGSPRADFRRMLEALPLGQNSRPLLAFSPNAMKAWASDGADEGGAGTFPDLAIPRGGSCAGIPAMACDCLTAVPGHGDMILLIDCAQTGGDAGLISFDAATQGAINMADSVSDGAQNLTSMFQTNSVALKAVREFTFKKLRADGCVALSNANYGGSP